MGRGPTEVRNRGTAPPEPQHTPLRHTADRSPPQPTPHFPTAPSPHPPTHNTVAARRGLYAPEAPYIPQNAPPPPPHTVAYDPLSNRKPRLPGPLTGHAAQCTKTDRPPIVQYCCCGLVSCPCLDREAERAPVNVRFCRRHNRRVGGCARPPQLACHAIALSQAAVHAHTTPMMAPGPRPSPISRGPHPPPPPHVYGGDIQLSLPTN